MSFFVGYNLTQTNSETNNDEKQLHIIDYNEKDFGQELKGEFYFSMFIFSLILIQVKIMMLSTIVLVVYNNGYLRNKY